MSKYSLAALVKEIKSDHKATKSASATLQQLIDDYLLSGEFDKYLHHHRHDLAKYIADPYETSEMLFRASQAGVCPQKQAYSALNKLMQREGAADTGPEEDRPVTQVQALYNGTFTHLRWHLLFDALAEKGMIEVLASEELKISVVYNLSGHIDKQIRFEFGGANITSIIDFKSIKSFYFQQLVKAKDDHKAQQYAYRLLGFNADRWLMLYECKDTHIRKLYDLEYDEVELQRLKQMYASMNAWVDEAIRGIPLAQRVHLDLIQDWCKSCGFNELCLTEHPDR